MNLGHIRLVGFDADDTLWVNEPRYTAAAQRLQELLRAYADADVVARRLHKIDVANLDVFGYGVKGFTLSMIQTAIDVSAGRVMGSEVAAILEEGRRIATMPTELFAHVEKTLRELSRKVDLMLITKGDLHEQHGRFERSGLQEHFRHVEVVAAKTPAIYRKLLDRHGIAPREFVMVGNAMKSDILPVLAIGGRAVYIHCADTWAHEHEAPPADAGERYYEVAHIGLLPALLAEMAGGPT